MKKAAKKTQVNPITREMSKLIRRLSRMAPDLQQKVQELAGVQFLAGDDGKVFPKYVGPYSTPDLCRVLVALRNLTVALDEMRAPVASAYGLLKDHVVPARFEDEGIPHLSIDEGYRIGVVIHPRISIVSDKRDDAYAWMTRNGLGDLITKTVNASSLASAYKARLAEGKDVPESLFRTHIQTVTSITRTK